MRNKITNKDIGTRLVSKISVSSPKDKRHLSLFNELPSNVKSDIIEAIAIAQVDHIIESMQTNCAIITLPLIGKFTQSIGRTIALTEQETQSLYLYNSTYSDLTTEQKKEVKELCKPIVIDKFIKIKEVNKGKTKHNLINIANIFNNKLKV